jgi:hypothetical protein
LPPTITTYEVGGGNAMNVKAIDQPSAAYCPHAPEPRSY